MQAKQLHSDSLDDLQVRYELEEHAPQGKLTPDFIDKPSINKPNLALLSAAIGFFIFSYWLDNLTFSTFSFWGSLAASLSACSLTVLAYFAIPKTEEDFDKVFVTNFYLDLSFFKNVKSQIILLVASVLYISATSVLSLYTAESYVASVDFIFLTSLLFAFSQLANWWLFADCRLISDEASNVVTLLDPEQSFSEKEVDASQLKVGDIVRFFADDIAPVDGTVLSGLVEVEERIVSGLGNFKIKGQGDSIFAGTTIVSGTVDVRVERLHEDAILKKGITHVLSEISDFNSLLKENFASQANILAFIVFCGLFCAVLWALLGQSWLVGLYVASGVFAVGQILLFVGQLRPFLNRHLLLTAFSRGVIINKFAKVFDSIVDCKNLACHYTEQENSPDSRIVTVSDFEISDGRIDEEVLNSVIISILGRSHFEVHQSIAQNIRDQISKVRLYEISDAQAYEDPAGIADAVYAKVEGTSFRFGSEEWLISEGVMIQPSDVPQIADNQACLLVAMGGEVVASIVLDIEKDSIGYQIKQLISYLKGQNLRASILSDLDSDKLVGIAKDCRVNIEDIFPSLNQEAAINRLAILPSVMFVAPIGVSSVVKAASQVSASPFNETIYSGFFDPNLPEVAYPPARLDCLGWLILATRKCNNLIFFQRNTAFLAFLGLTLGIASGALPIVTACLCAVLITGIVFFHR